MKQYRFWLVDDGRYASDSDSVEYAIDQEGDVLMRIDDCAGEAESGSVIAEEAIGRRDKDGQPIFQGDVVEREVRTLRIGVQVEQTVVVTGVVVWNAFDCCWRVDRISPDLEPYALAYEFHGPEGMQFDWGELKVIGNVMEGVK